MNNDPTPKLTLVRPRRADVEYWARDYLREVQNAVSAHMEVYGKNPGQWAMESSWGALQTIVNQQAAYALSLIRPVPVLTKPIHIIGFEKILLDYVQLSIENPLVKEGAATGNPTRYARLLTKHLEYLTKMLSTPAPEALLNEWRTLRLR